MQLSTKAASAVIAGALTVAACGGSAAPESAPADDAVVAQGEAPAEEPSLLEGSVPTVTGSQVDLANFKGKDVLVWVWAPW